MASSLEAMASTLIAMASNLIAMDVLLCPSPCLNRWRKQRSIQVPGPPMSTSLVQPRWQTRSYKPHCHSPYHPSQHQLQPPSSPLNPWLFHSYSKQRLRSLMSITLIEESESTHSSNATFQLPSATQLTTLCYRHVWSTLSYISSLSISGVFNFHFAYSMTNPNQSYDVCMAFVSSRRRNRAWTALVGWFPIQAILSLGSEMIPSWYLTEGIQQFCQLHARFDGSGKCDTCACPFSSIFSKNRSWRWTPVDAAISRLCAVGAASTSVLSTSHVVVLGAGHVVRSVRRWVQFLHHRVCVMRIAVRARTGVSWLSRVRRTFDVVERDMGVLWASQINTPSRSNVPCLDLPPNPWNPHFGLLNLGSISPDFQMEDTTDRNCRRSG